MKTINLYILFNLIALLGFSSCSPDKDSKEKPSVLTKLEIVQLPTKTVYGIGESLDLTGMLVKKIYSDGKSEDVSVSPVEVKGFDSSKSTKSQMLTVTIADVAVTFTIEIVSSIKMKKLPTKVIYAFGESLDLTGIEVVELMGGGVETVVSVTASNVSGFSSDKTSQNLVLTVTVGGMTTTFSVKVMPVKVVDGVLTQITEQIAELYLPMNVRSIVSGVFNHSIISTVVLNEGLERIGENAFFEAKVENITFPSTLKEIEKDAFYGCSVLKEVDLSNTKLTIIESSVFAFSGLTKVLFPAALKEIRSQAFTSTGNLKSVTFNEGLEFIGREAFRASVVENVNIPNSVRGIDDRAFFQCLNLREVKVYGTAPTSSTSQIVPTLGESAFAESQNLVIFEIPSSVENIAGFVLAESNGVVSLTLSANIKNLAFNVFRDSGLGNVIVYAAVPPIADVSKGAWQGFPSTIGNIKVPTSSLNAYKQAPGWNEYAAKIVAE